MDSFEDMFRSLGNPGVLKTRVSEENRSPSADSLNISAENPLGTARPDSPLNPIETQYASDLKNIANLHQIATQSWPPVYGRCGELEIVSPSAHSDGKKDRFRMRTYGEELLLSNPG